MRIEHSKVAIQRYVRKLLSAGQIALVNFIAPQNKKVWRLTLVAKDSELTEHGIKEKTTHVKRYTYLLGPSESCKTAAERFVSLITENQITFQTVVNAFSVEKLSKAFFNEYTLHYHKFCNYLQESIFRKTVFNIAIPVNASKEEKDKACKPIRDFVKKLLGRIVFLYFVQKKGWLGASDTNYIDGSTDFIKLLFKQSGGNESFYPNWLTVLFFETLNKERSNDQFTMPDGNEVKVPFLNGGLFDKEDHDEHVLTLPPELFHHPDFEDTLLTEKNKDYARGFLDFLNAFNFTVHEDSPDDHTVAVDPEMLGHIFENLLEDNKDKGAFYTPKEIVHYMAQESLIEYLNTQIPNADRKELEKFVTNIDNSLDNDFKEKINSKLDSVKICDPAIGSGAFPMGLLHEIFGLKERIAYDLEFPWSGSIAATTKANIIQESIYGVDIEQGAVDIARLRFWLSLVVDEEMPKPLPNLDYKIVVGNSLVSKFDDAVIEINWDEKSIVGRNNVNLIQMRKDLVIISEKQNLFFESKNNEKKYELKCLIRSLKLKVLINQFNYNKSAYINNNQKVFDMGFGLKASDRSKNLEIDLQIAEFDQILTKLSQLKENPSLPFNYFDWKLNFPEVLNPYLLNGNPGFDIVIGNPPYGAKLSKKEKNYFKELYSDVHMRTPDTFNYFISKSFKLLKENGVLSFIVPNNLLFQNENTKTRSLLINTNLLKRVVNLGDNTFKNADVPTCIFISVKTNKVEYYIGYSDNRKETIKTIDFYKAQKLLLNKEVNDVPDMVIGVSASGVKSMKDIEAVSWKLDDIALEMASGISTGGDKIFRISKEFAEQSNFEQEILKPVLVGGEIDKYKISNTNHFVIYTARDTTMSKYPVIESYLKEFKSKLQTRSEAKSGIMPWYSLNRQRYPLLFEEEKIIMRQTSDSIRATIDSNGFYCIDSILVFKINPSFSVSYKYALVLLNSKMNHLVYKNLTQEEGRVFAQVKPQNVRKLFIPKISSGEQKVFEILCDYLMFLNNVENQPVNQRIDNKALAQFFQQIVDACVVELIYGKEMENKQVNILELVRKEITSFENLPWEARQARATFEAHQKWTLPNSEVRNRLKIISLMCPDTAGKILNANEED